MRSPSSQSVAAQTLIELLVLVGTLAIALGVGVVVGAHWGSLLGIIAGIASFAGVIGASVGAGRVAQWIHNKINHNNTNG